MTRQAASTPPVAINDAEIVIAPFWDPELSPFPSCEPLLLTAGARIEQNWAYGVTLEWNETGPGTPAVGLRCPLGVDLTRHNSLRVQASAPKSAELLITVRIDGRDEVVLTSRGDEVTSEYTTAPLQGKLLESVELQFVASHGHAGMARVFWLMLVDADRERELFQPAPLRSPDWPGLIRDDVQEPSFEPATGLLFGAAELEAIRRKAAHPLYSRLLDNLRRLALAQLEDEPEASIGEYVPSGDHNFTRARDAGRPPLQSRALICAFVGLVDQDARMLRMAARCLLSMAHTPKWVGSFMDEFPGSTWRLASFYASQNAWASVLVRDWAGSILTPQAHALVNDALIRRALFNIEHDYLTIDRVTPELPSNVGLAFGRARVLGWLDAATFWPRAEAHWKQAARDLEETVEKYIHEDGGSEEGITYWVYGLGSAFWALAALARINGLTLADYVAQRVPNVRKTGDYLFAMLTTAGPAGDCLPVGDSYDKLSLGPVGFLAAAVPDGRFGELLAAIDPEEQVEPKDLHEWQYDYQVLALICGPEQLPAPAVRVPRFRILEDVGQLTSVRGPDGALVRLQLVGGKASPQHAHEDRGSFILEAGGERLVVDRGMLPYESTHSIALASSAYHNLACPLLGDGSPARQLNPCPAALIPEGSEESGRLHASIELGPAWGDLTRSARREIVSPSPNLFFVIDEIDLADPGPIAFSLHTTASVTGSPEEVVFAGQTVRLVITPLWPVEQWSVAEDDVSVYRQPVRRATWVSPHATSHRLVTALQVVPAAGAAQALGPEELRRTWAGEDDEQPARSPTTRRN